MSKLTAVVFMVVVSTGCTTWKPQQSPITALVTFPQTVRVTLRRDSARLTLEGAMVRSDSLFGTDQARRGRRAIATTDIQTYELRRVDAGRTVWLFVVLAIVLGFFAFMRGGFVPNE